MRSGCDTCNAAGRDVPPSLRWTYTYGNSQWRDLLTAYDGQSITYDQIGNPLIYRNGIRFAWVHGRQMSSVLSNGVPTYYTYNADGTRHSKTTSTNVEKTTTYYYVEGVLYAVESPDYTVVFQMDDTGRPYGFRLLRNDSPGYESQLYYKYNLQGDVVGIYDATGNEVVTYTYDPWGKLLSATGVDVLIDANPLLYRGYVYDKETEFYYCNSRYYDPETGRFISEDGYVSTGQGFTGYNMFAYCGNNPISRKDPNGEGWITALITSVAAWGAQYISNQNLKKNFETDSDSLNTTRNKIINDQNKETGRNFKFGLYNASWNACETIAVHNVKVLLGMDSSLSEVMATFYSSGAIIGYGFFGSNPYQIGEVLNREGITHFEVACPENMVLYGTYIMSFWTENLTIHTIAFSHTRQGYTAYNLYGDGSARDFNPMDYSDRYICGYYMW